MERVYVVGGGGGVVFLVMKVAVTEGTVLLFPPGMVTVQVGWVPVQAPLHPEKAYAEVVVAVRVMVFPATVMRQSSVHVCASFEVTVPVPVIMRERGFVVGVVPPPPGVPPLPSVESAASDAWGGRVMKAARVFAPKYPCAGVMSLIAWVAGECFLGLWAKVWSFLSEV